MLILSPVVRSSWVKLAIKLTAGIEDNMNSVDEI